MLMLQVKRWLYPFVLASVLAIWCSYMFLAERWMLFVDLWMMSLTMTLGSFVAGATAEGGAAIAFPVFTKLFHIPANEARTFGLMIQSVGMSAAALLIWTRGIKVLPQVIGWVTLGGAFGMTVGLFGPPIPAPYPKLLFTFVATAFGVALAIARWGLNWQPFEQLPRWTWQRRLQFVLLGILGGFFAANTGSGIDMLTFIVLTLALGINEKISTPTTVVIMALNSVIGVLLYGITQQSIGVVWNYWLVCVPIVVWGAPLGAYFAAKLKRDQIILFLLSLIAIELLTTIWLIPFTVTMILVSGGAVALCFGWFAFMLYHRHHRNIRSNADLYSNSYARPYSQSISV